MGYFRELEPDEIDCRVATINEKGCSLFLYKDARVDQNILDEKFGIFGWKRSHELIGDRLYCTVSVKDPETGEWISKQDVGTESYTEKEKGQASDSFKRACFNLGIGRELYTAPFIWISSMDFHTNEKDGKYTTYDHFAVKSIEYKDGSIKKLEIINKDLSDAVVYRLGSFYKESKNDAPSSQKAEEKPHRASDPVEEAHLKAQILAYVNRHKMDQEKIEKICKCYKVKSLNEMNAEQCKHYISMLVEKGGNINE